MSNPPTDLGTLYPPPPEQLARIRKELNEDESTRERDIGIIRAWLDQQPHLPRIDDKFILAFLRGCKFSLEKTKMKIDMYFSMRTGVPQIFIDRDIRTGSMKETIDRVYHAVMPRLTPGGHRVMVEYFKKADSVTPNVLDTFRLWFMMYEIRLCEELEPVAGDVYIIDGRVVTPPYAGQWTPTLAKNVFTCIQDTFPVRVHQIHMVHTHRLVHWLFNFIKPVLKEKLRNRFHFHGSNLESLYEMVPKQCLPDEFGGTAGSIDDMNEAWLQKMRQYGDWFRQQEAVKADESLRPGKPRNYDEMFGVEGSFRKLTID